ncbi:MAG: gliding motility-associated C-terminal domain-containing protein [Bacteroidales bacterium]|jgi:gliding motility-associated-like protein|nr:gliding motility-associated C-terminal domain-containing protein [Bacteroidales bacterium]
MALLNIFRNIRIVGIQFHTSHLSPVIHHLTLFTRHFSLFTFRFSLVLLLCLFFCIPTSLFAQVDAGRDDTINPGVPVTLTAKYGEDWIATPITLNDDEVTPFIDIGFSFTFYGNIYNQFSIGSNGWISFTYQPLWGGTRQAILIPSSDDKSPKNCILGPMQDYNPSLSQSPYIFYKTIGTQPNRKLIVMWCQVPINFCETDVATFQIVLNEVDNTIENHVFSKPLCTNPGNSNATLGIQNETGYIGQAIPGYNRAEYALSELSWKYTPIPNVVDEYTVSPIGFELQPITPGEKISYSWFEGSSKEPFSTEKTVLVTPTETTTYTVFCTICNGKTFSDQVTVNVIPKIPDAFTPNGDGTNDTFKIIGLPVENITKYNLKIYNRWGQMVFTSNDIREEWNGKMNNTGKICPDGAYAWVIYYEKEKGIKVTNKGTVMLLK